MYDTILRNQVKANRIVTVSEYIKVDSISKYNGTYFFDANGRVTEFNMVYGNGFNRNKFYYNKIGSWTKTIRYDSQDTSKIESIKIWTWDVENHLLKEERNVDINGKMEMRKTFESTYSKTAKGVYRIVRKRYEDNKFHSTIYGHDSTSGKQKFYVSYEYRPGDVDEKGRRAGVKTVARSYTKDFCTYDDVLTYQVFGKSEVLNKIKTQYIQLDVKGRLLEVGEINYDDVYMDFMQEHPEDFNPNFYAPVFLKALLEGKVQGVKNPEFKNAYDAAGRLIEKDLFVYCYTMKYNEKGQLVEQFGENKENQSTKQLYWYNEKGLISKTQSTSLDPLSENAQVTKQESTFVYSYRD